MKKPYQFNNYLVEVTAIIIEEFHNDRKPDKLKCKFYLMMKDNHESMKPYAEMAGKIKKESNNSTNFGSPNTDDNPATTLAINTIANVLTTTSILEILQPVLQSFSLAVIQGYEQQYKQR